MITQEDIDAMRTDPFDEGEEAFRAGKDDNANPYKDGSQDSLHHPKSAISFSKTCSSFLRLALSA